MNEMEDGSDTPWMLRQEPPIERESQNRYSEEQKASLMH